MFPSPSMGHIVWTLNFICVFGTERNKHQETSARAALPEEVFVQRGIGMWGCGGSLSVMYPVVLKRLIMFKKVQTRLKSANYIISGI